MLTLSFSEFDPKAASGIPLSRLQRQDRSSLLSHRRTDEIVTRVTDILDREQRRSLARCEGKRGDAGLKGGNPFLKHRLGRIHDAGANVA